MSDSGVHAAVETWPRSPAGPLPSEVTVPVTELEDWQVQLPDGSIRGGFTTRAEIELARREGRPIPPHVAEMEPRLKDR